MHYYQDYSEWIFLAKDKNNNNNNKNVTQN